MALLPGTRIGPYEIASPIGAGGMGEVYRATDTNLKRTVAIKVLPASVSADPDRVARFRREAEVLALLNHPNIAAIHGLERTDSTIALVMELVEGPTLADRLNAGAIPVDEVLPIAKQIAEALEAAHEQGIIHRDLKPANIKVRAEGTVKVLDFGLAKALDPAVSEAGMHSAAVTSPVVSHQGVILGTAAYMAPEQAMGKPVDRRADVFAFGCVLFEMLTGCRAFPGDSTSETIAAVLRAEPDWAALPPDVPAGLRTLLRPQTGTLSYGGANQAVPSRLLLIDRQGRVVREIMKDAVIADVRASRDGRHVAFVTLQEVAHGAVSTIELTRGLPVRLSTDADARRSDRLPVWSSDGTIVQFLSAILPGGPSFEVRRRRVDRADAEQLIATLPPPSFATDWSRDGEHIVVQSGLPWDLHRFAVSSKQSAPLVVGPFNETDGQIAPNGRMLAFVSDESGREEVYVQPFQASGRRQRVTIQGGREPKWRDDSRELFYRAADGALMAVSIAEREGELVPGPPARLAAGLAWALRAGSGLQRTFDVLPGGQQFVVNTFPPNIEGPEITVIANWPALLRK